MFLLFLLPFGKTFEIKLAATILLDYATFFLYLGLCYLWNLLFIGAIVRMINSMKIDVVIGRPLAMIGSLLNKYLLFKILSTHLFLGYTKVITS